MSDGPGHHPSTSTSTRSTRRWTTSLAAHAHVTFGFRQGASIHDPSGRLETTGHVMAHTKLRAQADIDADRFGDWLAQARELQRAEAG